MILDGAQIVEDFRIAFTRAGITPREIAGLIGISHSTIYRIFNGRDATTSHMLGTLRMATKWLKWFAVHGILADSPDPKARSEQIALSFKTWLNEV